MKKIHGDAKTVRELLKGVRYSIDYYQREYKWQDTQIRELVDDLTGKFLEEYQPGHARKKVADYPHYFLGSIIISEKDRANFIVDGQQRLTSLTLLLIMLRSFQKGLDNPVNVDELIVCTKWGTKSFNLDVDERIPVMKALYDEQPFDPTGRSESVQNLYKRYRDLQTAFPDELLDAERRALPYFVDWLLENVHFVEITAYSDNDAYTIFETMNDRGLSLSPTDMLKGYLLTNIDNGKRTAANTLWRARIRELTEAGREVESDCFKAWLRSQYANKIRERKKEAHPEDFDRIGTEFHRWLRDASKDIGLQHSEDFSLFVERDFDFYSRLYLRLLEASQKPVDGLEYVLYNAQNGFTLQYMLLLAPIKPGDSDGMVLQKLRLVGRFVDILLAWRLWNSRSIAYSTMKYAMFIVMRDTRGLSPEPLARKLREVLSKEQETFASTNRLGVNQHNRYALHRFLARLTDYVETQSDKPSHYIDYVSQSKNPYEVEHIWADHYDRHTDEFDHPEDFTEFRNRIGGLLLLPKSFNASYGDLTYEKKLDYYDTHNLLAFSLHSKCYDHNPNFLRFVNKSGLPFKHHGQFKKSDLEERGVLYRNIAERIWNPDNLLAEVNA